MIVARISLGCAEHETANVAANQAIDTCNIVINGPPFMTNDSIMLRSRSDGPRFNWPNCSRVLIFEKRCFRLTGLVNVIDVLAIGSAVAQRLKLSRSGLLILVSDAGEARL